MRSWVFGAALAVFGSEVAAQMQCDPDLLVQMAEEVLESRADLTGFAGRRVGGDAAYLMMRYGEPDMAAIIADLQAGRPYQQTDELFMAERIARPGPAGVDQWGGDPRDVLMDGFLHVQRAILLLDNGQTFFDLIAQIEADPERNDRFQQTWFGGASLHALVTDQPPEVLGAIAERAEAGRHLIVAASLFALMPEGAYEAFWERVKGSGDPETRRADPLSMNYNGTIALMRDQALTDPDRPEGLEARLNRQRLLLVFKAGMAEAASQVLTITVNQTGLTQELAVVSEAFLRAIEDGEIDPVTRPEEGWAWLAGALRDALGPQYAEQTLSSFDLAADRRHYAGRAQEVLDMATAAEAAGPWLRGQVDTPPARPEALSAGFDWDEALAVWADVREGGPAAYEGQDMALAIEGLIQRGEIDAGLDLAEGAGGANGRIDVAEDVMTRLNRLCDQHGILPGSAVLLGGQLIYDFQ